MASGTLLLTFIDGTIIMQIALQGPRCDLKIHTYKGPIAYSVNKANYHGYHLSTVTPII